MRKSAQTPATAALTFDGGNIFVWLLQSSVIVALVTAILYALGANFDYRLRWEFGIQNIGFARSATDLTYDGLIVVSAWFKTYQPYLLGILAISFAITFQFKPLHLLSVLNKRLAAALGGVVLMVASGILLNMFLRDRASTIASALREKSRNGLHTITLVDKSVVDGYVVMSNDQRTAILTRSGSMVIYSEKDISNFTMKLN